MNRLIIVRHGNTFAPGEAPRRIGARTDLPLVDEGVAQAHRVGRWLSDRGMTFETVLTGPLRRAWETASLIISEGGWAVVPRKVEWLNEIDHGPDEGRTEADIQDRIGRAALDAWEQRSAPPEGWIVRAEMRLASWRSILRFPPAGDCLLVTSNGAARFALEALPTPPSFPRKLRTGAYGLLERRTQRGGHRWNVAAWDVRP